MLALSCVLPLALVALAALAWPGVTAASGSGTLTFTPVSGPVGTRVTVTISAGLLTSTPYVLSASPAGGASTTCSGAVVLPDAPKIIVVPYQPTTTAFIWPAEFSSGAYYLCAGPASGQAGPAVWSHWSYVVSAGPSPTATASQPLDSGVAVNVPKGGVAAGGTFTLVVDTGAALNGNAPTAIMLIELEDLSTVPVRWEQTAQVGTIYSYEVTVPANAPSGRYDVRVTAAGGSLSATSADPFLVVAGSAPPAISSPLGASATSQTNPLLVAAIALLLALAVASLVGPLLRRRRRNAHPH